MAATEVEIIPPRRRSRTYSDRQKAEALAIYDACQSLTETSRQTGIPDSTISQWVTGKRGQNDDLPKLREEYKTELAERFDTVAHAYLDRALQKSAIKKTSGYYAVKAAGEAVDKSQLLRGDPTEIPGIADSERLADQLAQSLLAAISRKQLKNKE